MGESLLVTLAANDSFLGGLGLSNGLLDGDVPAITLSVVGGLEGVLVAVELEGELVWRLLLELGSLRLDTRQFLTPEYGSTQATNEVQDTGRVGLLLGVLGKAKKTSTGLAGVGSSWMSDLWLLATEVVAELVGADGLLSKPEVLLGELEAPAKFVSTMCRLRMQASRHSLDKTWGLVAEHTRFDGFGRLGNRDLLSCCGSLGAGLSNCWLGRCGCRSDSLAGLSSRDGGRLHDGLVDSWSSFDWSLHWCSVGDWRRHYERMSESFC